MFYFLYQVFYFRPPYSKRRKAPCIFISFLLQVYGKVYCKTLSQLTVSIVRVSENVLFLLCVVLEADNFVSGQKCPQNLKSTTPNVQNVTRFTPFRLACEHRRISCFNLQAWNKRPLPLKSCWAKSSLFKISDTAVIADFDLSFREWLITFLRKHAIILIS